MIKQIGYRNLRGVAMLGVVLILGITEPLEAQQGSAGPSPGANPSAGSELTLIPGSGKVTSGQLEFREFCQQCHGPDGLGNGPTAAVLKKKPANLTVLARNNGGVFPTQEVRDYITGVKFIESHGMREMPLWGLQFRYRRSSAQEPGTASSQAEIDAKINRLVDYIRSIQVH